MPAGKDSLLENFIAADVEVAGRYVRDGWLEEHEPIPLRDEDFDGPRRPAQKPPTFADEFLAINEPLGGRFVVEGWCCLLPCGYSFLIITKSPYQ